MGSVVVLVVVPVVVLVLLLMMQPATMPSETVVSQPRRASARCPRSRPCTCGAAEQRRGCRQRSQRGRGEGRGCGREMLTLWPVWTPHCQGCQCRRAGRSRQLWTRGDDSEFARSHG